MPSTKRKPARTVSGLTFNHAMVYVREVAPALHFYSDLLGFKVLEDFKHHGVSVYARLRPSHGNSTIALHMIEPGKTLAVGDNIRLYFETKNLKSVCGKLQKAGVKFSQEPKLMPWGWMHAYLDDPDGHEISLYWAGKKRVQKTLQP
jgi:lactoylglutathione lyase